MAGKAEQQRHTWRTWAVAAVLVLAVLWLLAQPRASPGGSPTWHARVLREPAAAAATAVQAAAAAAAAAVVAPAAPQPAGGHAAWLAAANANLTAYRASALERWGPGGFQSFVESYKREWPKFEPVIQCPPGRPLRRYGGEGDGGKLLCELNAAFKAPSGGCVIYSMGSAGSYGFELEMLEQTTCQVHTFDCTYDGKVLHPTRHHYHKWCIGDGASNRGLEYRTWSNVTASLGHSRVDLLKIDIESHEYPVFAAFRPEHNLPAEISVEIHLRHRQLCGDGKTWKFIGPQSTAALGLTFLHLANLGYGEYAMEVNPQHVHCCSEFSFMRINKGSTAVPLP